MNALTSSTTARDVMALFKITDQARKEYRKWEADIRYKETVVPHVLRHRTEAVYQLTPRDVAAACNATKDRGGHALASIKKETVERIQEINDWNPAFAFSHVFHHIVETVGDIPTWRQLTKFINQDPTGIKMLGEPVRRVQEQYSSRHGARLIEDAVQWRLGNAYYSFLRELHVLTHMRSHGLDVCVHPLADALFRVDAWHGRHIFCLYVGNVKYRNDHAGRKKEAEKILGGPNGPFTFETINLPRATEYGKVHLASETDLEARIRVLLREGNEAQ
ncbi:hypothetical protein [Streptomyces sioyaensis]|uniref:hypothetical protein n=1 Tax=Streptomyces sioyaensis TaxID=67364 RepID=UPI0037A54B11